MLWIDTETTGTDPYRHGLVQVAGIIEIDGKEEASFDYFIKPFAQDVIEEEALQVNGISREDLQSFMSPDEGHRKLVDLFARFVNRYQKKDKFIIAGYNSQFDVNFLHQFFLKNKDVYFGSWAWWPSLDVSVIAMQHLQDQRMLFPNFKLETVASHMGIEVEGNAHDALVDIRMTRDLYHRICG